MSEVNVPERSRCKTVWQIQILRERDRPTTWRLTVNGTVHGDYETWHGAEKERRRLIAP